jgi:predicted nucleic acid-binding protein
MNNDRIKHGVLISIIVMKEWNIHKVLTSDHHFVQAGFEALLINK